MIQGPGAQELEFEFLEGHLLGIALLDTVIFEVLRRHLAEERQVVVPLHQNGAGPGARRLLLVLPQQPAEDLDDACFQRWVIGGTAAGIVIAVVPVVVRVRRSRD